MRKCRVIKGKYAGLVGISTEVNAYGNVMFYPERGFNPFRVCLKADCIEYIKRSEHCV